MTFDPAIVVQYGILGVVLAWFMFRMERKIDLHTAVINDLVRTISMELISRPSVPPVIKDQANAVLDRANARVAKAHAESSSQS
jgi:hypothetical protein